MSYEGYEQHVCENGHRFNTDAGYCYFDDENVRPKCPTCEACSTWYNAVDETNCDSVGVIIDWSSLQLIPAESKTCDLGHTHIIKEATYRIPTDEELKDLRHYFDEESGDYKLLSSYQDTF